MKQKTPHLLAAVGLMSAIIAIGCAHKNDNHTTTVEEHESVTRSDEPEMAPAPAPVQDICEARCDQEERCKNIGKKKKYATREECAAKIEENLAPDLNQFDCPKGYDRAQLDKCLNDIRHEDCMSPVETLSRIISCRSGAICLK